MLSELKRKLLTKQFLYELYSHAQAYMYIVLGLYNSCTCIIVAHAFISVVPVISSLV